MGTVLEFVLPALLFAVLELLWCRPARSPRRPHVVEGRGRYPTSPPHVPDWDPFAGLFIRRRLDVLADELHRLDGDPTVFARAFRTRVAQLAYDALLADAALLEAEAAVTAVTAAGLEIIMSGSALREELEV